MRKLLETILQKMNEIKVKNKKGEVLDIQMQQYEIGLYVAVYKDGRILDQLTLPITKEKFLQDIHSGKLGWKVVEE